MAEKPEPRYRIIEQIGHGSFGVVFLAHDNKLGRKVAVKTMTIPEGVEDEELAELVARFEREARAVAMLRHDNIVTIFDISKSKGQHFISMEYLEGRPLSRMLASPLPVDQAVDFAMQILSALEYAHANGVIHRDIKPENIFVLGDGRVKLVDFGLARVSAASTLTQTGILVGTTGYIPPELFKGQGADERSDIFAFGVVFYEMLCGKRPFGPDGDSDREHARIMYRILTETPQLPSRICPGIPTELELIVLQCLEKDPEWRYQTAGQVLNDLEKYTGTAGAPRLEPRPHAAAVAAEGAGASATPGPAPVPSPSVVPFSTGAMPTHLQQSPEAQTSAAGSPPSEATKAERKRSGAGLKRRISWKVAAVAIAVALIVAGGVVALLIAQPFGGSDVVSKVNRITLARADGGKLDLESVPVGTDLTMEVEVTCICPIDASGRGDLTMSVRGGDQLVQQERRNVVFSSPGSQLFVHRFRITWSKGEGFVARADLDVMTAEGSHKSSEQVAFRAMPGNSNPVTLEEAKVAATAAVDKASTALAALQQRGIQPDYMEQNLDTVKQKLVEYDNAPSVQALEDYALTIARRAEEQMKQGK